MDQSSRYADLALSEKDLINNGQHVLCAYIMKPKGGGDYLATAAHFAAESSTGTNVTVSTTDDFTKSVDAIVYEIDADKEIMKIAYPVELFDIQFDPREQHNLLEAQPEICHQLTADLATWLREPRATR